MLQGLFAILLFILIVITIVVMLCIRYVMLFIHRIRRMMNNDYDDTADSFSQNYTGRRQTQYSFRQDDRQRQQSRRQGGRYNEQEAVAETIIDNRDPRENRKIFADNEGEYVDFVEEK